MLTSKTYHLLRKVIVAFEKSKNGSIYMRSKITFFLVFILSFVVFHDSFLALLDKKEQVYVITQVEHPSSLSQQDTNIHEIHNMFHILAILTLNSMVILPFNASQSIISPNVQKAFSYHKTIIKPPIA